MTDRIDIETLEAGASMFDRLVAERFDRCTCGGFLDKGESVCIDCEQLTDANGVLQ